MDAGNHQLLANSSAYDTFLLTSENCKLQIQAKIHLMFVYHVFAFHVPKSLVHVSPSPAFPRPRDPESPRLTSGVPESSRPNPYVPVPLSHSRPRSCPH